MTIRANGKPGSHLKTIQVAPLAMAWGALSATLQQFRKGLELAQRFQSSVKSVGVVADQMRVRIGREEVDSRALMRVPLVAQRVGLRGGVTVENAGSTVLLNLCVDALLLDPAQAGTRGTLASLATCRFNTQIRLVLHETIDVKSARPKTPRRKRLTQDCATQSD